MHCVEPPGSYFREISTDSEYQNDRNNHVRIKHAQKLYFVNIYYIYSYHFPFHIVYLKHILKNVFNTLPGRANYEDGAP